MGPAEQSLIIEKAYKRYREALKYQVPLWEALSGREKAAFEVAVASVMVDVMAAACSCATCPHKP